MRREADLALAALPGRFADVEDRVSRVESDLAANTALTRKVDLGTSKIVAFVDDVEVVWRVCKRVRALAFRGAKFTAAIAVAFTSVVAALQVAGQIDVLSWVKGVVK